MRAKYIVFIVFSLLASGGLAYCFFLASSYITEPTKKRIEHASVAVESSLAGHKSSITKLYSLSSAVKPERFSLSTYDENRFFSSFDNTLVYEKLSDTLKAEKLKEGTDEQSSPPVYKISSILVGDGKALAVIDGKIYRKNHKVSENEYIKHIDARKILFDGKWGERWVFVTF